ncbi:SLC13 family permease [Sandaracinus amylolyticus]|uniref:SLC13 family permease n=1 Tax=Sandaracinus amylolyticus TaxID=927083 RepID=UPI00069F8CA5|nr:SLC13 family permease [Sandaracinus amylolyticus]
MSGDTKDAAEGAPGNARMITGAFLAPLSFVALWLAPLPLEPAAHRLVALFAAVLIAWVTEVVSVAVTALMIGPALVALQITDAGTAFRYYADPLLFLFVGGFMLAEAMQRHGLDRRFANAVVALPFVRGSAWRTQAALVAAAVIVSMWISNTATCAMMLPILLGLPGLERPESRREKDPATGPLLALAYVCSTAGLGTLIGTPPNLITTRLLENAGVRIGFLEWMALGVPAALVLSFVAAAITLRRGGASSAPVSVQPMARAWTRGEKVTALAFVLAVIGWTAPAIAEVAGASFAEAMNDAMHPGAVAVLACLPLFLVPDPAKKNDEGEVPPVLPWSVAVRIDWGVILLFGGGISLGTQLERTGLAASIGRWVVEATGATDVWTLSAIACFATVVLSEVASNTAAANILVPLVIAIAQQLGVSPIPPALAVGVGASVGFMLPIATGPNAMVYATGRVPQTSMMRAGLFLDVACLVLVLVLLRLICPLMGWV